MTRPYCVWLRRLVGPLVTLFLLGGCGVAGTNATPVALPTQTLSTATLPPTPPLAPTVDLPPAGAKPRTPVIGQPPDPERMPTPDSALPMPPMPNGLIAGQVVGVVDGDTVDVQINGAVERMRLIGINTPETVDPRRPVECFGKEASEHAKQLLSGQQVLVESDPSQDTRDKYGRLLVYVWLPEGRLFNLQMIVDGYAYEYTYDNPYKYQATFKQAEAEARSAERGLWSPATCAGGAQPISPEPTAQPGAAARVDCHATPSGPAPNTPVAIVSIDKDAETVRLRNVSAAPVRLDGWTMCSIRGGQQQSDIGGVLQPGEQRDYRQRGSSIWSNSDRDDGALYDAQGQLVSYWQDAG